MLLNTDLHNRNLPQKEKMRVEDFVRNNRGINGGQDLPRELLTGLYHSIKRHEMRMKEGDMWESNSLTFMAPRISGWLEKKVQGQLGISRFHRFWFVLTNGCLFYFKGPADQDPRCIIILEAVMVRGREGRKEGERGGEGGAGK
jgi:cytohesin